MPKGEHRTAVAEHIPVENPAYWRRRAEEARTRAESRWDTKGLMLEIAESYERIAKSYEEQRASTNR
jgi:hypothetical protein